MSAGKGWINSIIDDVFLASLVGLLAGGDASIAHAPVLADLTVVGAGASALG
jgi:hypothetical protein